uniref:Uncharacterized protein n=1 Tax=Clostridium perfringens TaxID=1502 RepID=A0A126G9H7_CLOPF|nr:hypothetical protein [Clostridium perfringens]ALD82537.1 hypothetical protein JFP838_pB0003 [Clostridium perfringens]
MNFKSKVLGTVLLVGVSLGNITNVVYASSYVHQDGRVYVTNWDNYDYTNGCIGSVILEDERGNKPIFSQNTDYDWVSSVLTVKGTGGFGFSFNSSRVKVYYFESRKEITNGYLRGGQKIYIVSKDDPTYITLSISPAIIIEN